MRLRILTWSTCTNGRVWPANLQRGEYITCDNLAIATPVGSPHTL
jgi:hypothetical protein